MLVRRHLDLRVIEQIESPLELWTLRGLHVRGLAWVLAIKDHIELFLSERALELSRVQISLRAVDAGDVVFEVALAQIVDLIIARLLHVQLHRLELDSVGALQLMLRGLLQNRTIQMPCDVLQYWVVLVVDVLE